MKKLLLVVLAVVIVLAVAAISCGSDGNGTSTATNTPGQQESQNLEENSEVFFGDQDWEFSDIPKYPGADEAYKIRGEELGEPPTIMEHVIYITDDSVQQAADYYQAGMADNGWEEVYWGSFTGGYMGSFSKPGDVGAAIGIALTAEGDTAITLDKRYPKS